MTEPVIVPLALPPSARWPLPRVLPVHPSSAGRLFDSPSYCWRPSGPPRSSLSWVGASAPRREADRLSRRRRQVRNRALAMAAAVLVVLTGIGSNLLDQITERSTDLFIERSRNTSLADSIAGFQVALESRVQRSIVLQRIAKGRPAMPVFGRVSSRFASRRRHPLLSTWRPHRGVDIDVRSGTPVRPVVQGRVVKVARNFGFGLFVELDHGGGVSTRYAHLREVHVRHGQLVRPNMTLGKTGSSGFASGPHLHYEVMKHGRQVDPLTFQLVVLERVPVSIERVATTPAPGTPPAVELRAGPEGSGRRQGVGKRGSRGVGRGSETGRAAPKPNAAAISAPRTGVNSDLQLLDKGRFK